MRWLHLFLIVFVAIWYLNGVVTMHDHEQIHARLCEYAGGTPHININYLLLKGETLCEGVTQSSGFKQYEYMAELTEIVGYSFISMSNQLVITIFMAVFLLVQYFECNLHGRVNLHGSE